MATPFQKDDQKQVTQVWFYYNWILQNNWNGLQKQEAVARFWPETSFTILYSEV